MGSIFVTGDKHGAEGIMSGFSEDVFPAGNFLTGDDVVIILGDLGVPWLRSTPDEDEEVIRWLSLRPWTTLFVDGNHENFDVLDSLPEEEMFGAPVGVLRKNIYHLRRGYVYTISGRRCFSFGGAASPDRESRIEGVSWWRRELPNWKETDRGIESLGRYEWSVDHVFTHAAPEGAKEYMLENFKSSYRPGKRNFRDPVSIYLETLAEKLLFTSWHFGHYHAESGFFHAGRSRRGYFRCEYKTVRPLYISPELRERVEKKSGQNN